MTFDPAYRSTGLMKSLLDLIVWIFHWSGGNPNFSHKSLDDPEL